MWRDVLSRFVRHADRSFDDCYAGLWLFQYYPNTQTPATLVFKWQKIVTKVSIIAILKCWRGIGLESW